MKNYTHKSIIEVAQSRGSKTETKKGAWNFILKNWYVKTVKYRNISFGLKNNLSSLKRDWANFYKQKQEKLAKYILGDQFEQKIAERQKYIIEYNAQKNWAEFCKNKTVINKHVFALESDISWDNNFYSKSWHRKYGGKKEVSNRRVEIFVFDPSNFFGTKCIERVQISQLRDEEILKVAANFFGFKEKKLSTAEKSIKLKWYFDAEKIEQNIYALKIGDKIFHYCATDEKTGATYHADTVESAKSGLTQKIEAKKLEIQKRISIDYCRDELHFCKFGIQSFLQNVGLEKVTEISVAGLKKYLSRIPKSNFLQYSSELKQLGVL